MFLDPAHREQHARARTRCGPGCRAGSSASRPRCRTAPPGARRARPAAPSAPVCRRRRRRGHLQPGAGGIGVGRHAFSGLGDESGGARRGARRRVGLVRVVQFDDLDRFEEARGLLAKCIDSTAPIAKFGAISIATSGLSASQLRTCPIRLSVKPVVPTTAWMPLSIRNFRLSITTSGWVKSMTTSVSASVSRLSGSPASTSADRVRSSAA